MTQKEWEKKLLKHLKPLSKEEKNEILEYYREIYGDKLDAGFSNEDILREFGFPEDCAARILAEDNDNPRSAKRDEKKHNMGISIPYLIGMFFLTILLILPLSCAMIIVIASFLICAISGCIVSLAGFVVILLSFIQYPIGITVLPGVSAGICMIGLGAILFVAFFLATKYTAIATFKALKWIYIRKKGA